MNLKHTPEQEVAIIQFSAEYRQYRGPRKKTSVLQEFLADHQIWIGIRRAQQIMKKVG